ncbi:MAG TPA: ATP-binding cassette domain-containing protein [Caldisericia bacterium]|nr:ATP-binding cassette domain-containing protein [Caldisericia bacterium]HPF49069.1 ATP-binding cassette domain-containing protein [Caldisericia bacterium]HPI83067.1 ATP-binding cassette domain-containing protein [Caldisericia bacterium]HPQ92294.1 ATP-binding cassette domain-containing protein [Caldisericia bacterium]HRV74608.1 ATP-binding cassette domain-containing protein [Caldisericia bacterium]
MVSIKNLTAGYGRQKILDDVSFEVEPGKLVGVIGPNGSGKSTLIRAFFGIADILSGSITIDGKDITNLPIVEISQIIGVCRPVDFKSVHLPVLSYINAGTIEVSEEALQQIKREFELEQIINKPISELSHGQMQRVSLAQVVARNPRVYLLDEPTSHLDLKYKIQTLKTIRNKTQNNSYALAVIHEIDLAREYCDEIIGLKDGKLEFQGKSELLDDKRIVSSLFGLES